MLESVSDVSDVRWVIGGSQHDHAWQSFQSSIIAFGIDDAHAVALDDHLLAKETGGPGLSGLRFSTNQNVAPPDYARDVLAVRFSAHGEPVAAESAGRKPRLGYRPANVSGNGGWTLAVDNPVPFRLGPFCLP